jgi:hypothetical protein
LRQTSQKPVGTHLLDRESCQNFFDDLKNLIYLGNRTRSELALWPAKEKEARGWNIRAERRIISDIRQNASILDKVHFDIYDFVLIAIMLQLYSSWENNIVAGADGKFPC